VKQPETKELLSSFKRHLKDTVCLISSVGLDFSTTFTQEFWPPETIYWRIAESVMLNQMLQFRNRIHLVNSYCRVVSKLITLLFFSSYPKVAYLYLCGQVLGYIQVRITKFLQIGLFYDLFLTKNGEVLSTKNVSLYKKLHEIYIERFEPNPSRKPVPVRIWRRF
jgi:hypothetical protein